MDTGSKTDEVMTEAERAQLLIDRCCGGSAVNFATSIHIDKTRLSKIVHGQLKLSGLFDVIIATYPEVNPQWLRTGTGYPGDLSVQMVRERYERILAEKDSLIRTLQKIIDKKL